MTCYMFLRFIIIADSRLVLALAFELTHLLIGRRNQASDLANLLRVRRFQPWEVSLRIAAHCTSLPQRL